MPILNVWISNNIYIVKMGVFFKSAIWGTKLVSYLDLGSKFIKKIVKYLSTMYEFGQETIYCTPTSVILTVLGVFTPIWCTELWNHRSTGVQHSFKSREIFVTKGEKLSTKIGIIPGYPYHARCYVNKKWPRSWCKINTSKLETDLFHQETSLLLKY